MNFEKFEKIRMNYYPVYIIISFLLGLGLIALLVFIVLPSYTLEKYLISAAILLVLFTLLFSTLFIMDKLFYKRVNKEYVLEILTPLMEKETGLKPVLDDLENIKIQTGLFGNNKPKVKELFQNEKVKLYEVSIWKDYKFHGICIELEVDNPLNLEFAFLNYKYFLKLKFNKNLKKISGVNDFDNKFKLYSLNNFKLKEQFYKEFYRQTHDFKSIAFEIKNNKVFVVYDVLDTAFQPNISKKMNKHFVSSLNYHINTYKRIKRILEVFNNR